MTFKLEQTLYSLRKRHKMSSEDLLNQTQGILFIVVVLTFKWYNIFSHYCTYMFRADIIIETNLHSYTLIHTKYAYLCYYGI